MRAAIRASLADAAQQAQGGAGPAAAPAGGKVYYDEDHNPRLRGLKQVGNKVQFDWIYGTFEEIDANVLVPILGSERSTLFFVYKEPIGNWRNEVTWNKSTDTVVSKHYNGNNFMGEQVLAEAAQQAQGGAGPAAAAEKKVGYDEEPGTSQDLAQKYNKEGKKVGIMIAGNAGRPGGALGKLDASGLEGHWSKIKTKHYSTQEESVLVDWIKASEKNWTRRRDFNAHIFFKSKLGNPQTWGMQDTSEGSLSVKTIQGWDYTLPLYNDTKKNFRHHYYRFVKVLDNELMMGSDEEVFPASLFFVFGPNVAAGHKSKYSTMLRTKVEGYDETNEKHYMGFRLAVKTALAEGMEAMFNAGCQVGILARVSGGIYSGKGRTNRRINAEYQSIVEEIIGENPELEKMHFIMPVV